MGKGNKPTHNIAVSAAIRKGKYIQGPSIGMWAQDEGPMARGSVKEEYLEKLHSFIGKCIKKDIAVSFALFKNKKGKGRDAEEEEEEEEEEGKDKDDDEPYDCEKCDEEHDEDDKLYEKHKKYAEKKSKKKKKKDSDWDFEEDD